VRSTFAYTNGNSWWDGDRYSKYHADCHTQCNAESYSNGNSDADCNTKTDPRPKNCSYTEIPTDTAPSSYAMSTSIFGAVFRLA
jgi:hypothetical protein